MTYLIEIKGVSKRYSGQKREVHALRHVSLDIAKGDIFGIIGLSGAGKSTLMRCLSRLEKPSLGQILIHGRDISRLEGEELRKLRRNIGMIFQHFNLLSSRTVEENVSLPLEIYHVDKEERRKRVYDLLHLVGLEHKRDAYPAQLSGGEKQRVGIARALALNPEILLSDESTSALDPQTMREILSLLKKLNAEFNITIVLITHQMEVIKQICNKVAVLEEGTIVESGSVAKIFSEPTHPMTRSLLLHSMHELPASFLERRAPNRRLIRLYFKESRAEEPVIAELVRRFQIDVNILLGWIDTLQTATIGVLIVELLGAPVSIDHALKYLQEKGIHSEEVTE